ncbi:hypothetical protein N3114_11385 [Aliarcobacter butzleri]|uniref:hypothetical protein n=1 Tax=Aliarcobacter butzleri TaxID=28197 RepID=UPI0021B22392|nr:hypothetical protein [Aliarcobacter butzleri]UXC28559.1 hypothetical protein N3114_07710 [Aliarcobacter butzleri]UXC29242.1 hypothetical protein N3114_11385 [Aliarcobacter butzleri]
MNKLQIISFTFLSVLISGCAIKKTSSENNVYIPDNKNHIIGDKDNYIEKVIYLEGKDKEIVFYIDKFPYKKEFDLCNITNLNKEISIDYPNAKYINNDCKSYIYINKVEGDAIPYRSSFDIKFLTEIEYNKSSNLFLKKISRTNILNTKFQKGLNDVEDVKLIKFLFKEKEN